MRSKQCTLFGMSEHWAGCGTRLSSPRYRYGSPHPRPRTGRPTRQRSLWRDRNRDAAKVRAYVRTRSLMTSCSPPNPSRQDKTRLPWRSVLVSRPRPLTALCPSFCPSTVVKTTGLVFDIWLLKCSGAKGTRTPGLLHAMNHPGIPRPGYMPPDQAVRWLTQADTGPDKHSLAPFCPSTCPSQ